MKKIITNIAAIAMITVTLSGCAPGQNTGGATAVGAATGGLLASTMFHGRGSVAGIMAGALIGGSLGYMVGRNMDQQDRMNMQNAIAENNDASWTNEETSISYEVHPVRSYEEEGRYCREYQTRVKIDGEWKKAYGKACRMPDGAWKIVK